jgi:hypothetical protein
MKTLFTMLLLSVCMLGNAQTKIKFSYYSLETLDAIGATQEQKDKIAVIRVENETKIRAVKNDAALNEEQKKAAYADIYKAGGARYFEVLSKEQKQSLNAYIAKLKSENK